MYPLLEMLSKFLRANSTPYNRDLIERFLAAYPAEVQVNVDEYIGKPVDEDRRGLWRHDGLDYYHIRYPKNSDTNPKWKEPMVRFPFELFVTDIGSTGYSREGSRWVGFDVDTINGHQDGLSAADIARIDEAIAKIDYAELRRSTRGEGRHIYVEVNGFETANHTEHAALARAIQEKLSHDVGFNFSADVDCCGGNMWFWSNRATEANRGFEQLKPATRILTPDDIPDWREQLKVPSVSLCKVQGQAVVSTAQRNEAALAACQRITTADGKDGSKRLFAISCRLVEHDCTDDDAIHIVRTVAAENPFPKHYSNDEILKRIRDAEKRCERGVALQSLAKPRINVTCIDLDKVNKRCWSMIETANEPPKMFRYGGLPGRIDHDDNGQPVIRGATSDMMRHHLSQWIHFYKTSDQGEYPVPPPKDVVQDLLATADIPLPILTRLVDTPVFGSDCSLLTQPGYHPAARTYYSPSDDFQLDPIPPKPTPEEIEKARNLIGKELLVDFPFVSDAERAHAIALLLLPFARSLIHGPTPFHLIEKPTPGTGASLLISCLHHIVTGRDIAMMTEGKDEEEWRKRITAKLRTGPQFIVIDNIRLPLESAAVASALTAEEWEDRILCVSQMVRLPIQNVWLGTGNNPTLSDEIARRTIRCRLDAKVDRPWLRNGFHHPDLRAWVKENRSQLVHACLTLIQAWIAAGRPEGEQTLGMYESWSKVMGGIFDVAKIPGFLGNLVTFYDQTDKKGVSFRSFLSAWHEKYGTNYQKPVDLFAIAQDHIESSLGDGSDHSQRTRFGKMMLENLDRVYDVTTTTGTVSVQIERGGVVKGIRQWRLSTTKEPAIAV